MKEETRELKQKQLEEKAQAVYSELKYIAKLEKLDLTENAINVARFRAKLGIPLTKCACCQRNIRMGCMTKSGIGIKKECLKWIRQNGKCYCNVFKLKDTK